MELSAWIVLIVAVLVLLFVAWFYVSRRRPPSAIEEAPPRRISKTAAVLGEALRHAWGSGMDDSTWEVMEDALLAADVGVEATSHIMEGVRTSKPDSAATAKSELASLIKAEFEKRDRSLRLVGRPATILVVGVNGTGKTTTIAKLARMLTASGRTVLLGAADTFRAAAGEQLRTWGERVDVDVVVGQEGGDPASVAHDTIASARARDADVVIIDTAGRLHGKRNLMDEMGKIHRVAARESDVDEVLLVLDASAGQNGVAQVRGFTDAVPVTGLVLTKLDGTAKGGVVVAVEKELGVPVKLIGVGEGVDDLLLFDPDTFVDALLEGA